MSPVADDRSPLLYLVHRIPFPPNKGDKVRSFNILRQLARRHRVFLGTFVDHPDDEAHVDRLAEWCEESHVVRLNPRLARVLSLRGLLGGEALSLPYYRDAGLRQWAAQVVAREGIREAVVFSGPMAQYLDVPGLTRRVIDFCDLDSAKWTQYAPDHRWPMSWLYRREGAKLLDFGLAFDPVETNVGRIVLDLHAAQTPITVNSFVFLALNHFYDGIAFHRVLEGFVAQGGDPNTVDKPPGTWGTGGPGYRFADEFHPELTFDRPYLLAMANAGPNTNGSQFFITVAPTAWLNFKHSIFGEVADQESRDVVDAIATTPTGPGDRPRDEVVISSITITRD